MSTMQEQDGDRSDHHSICSQADVPRAGRNERSHADVYEEEWRQHSVGLTSTLMRHWGPLCTISGSSEAALLAFGSLLQQTVCILRRPQAIATA